MPYEAEGRMLKDVLDPLAAELTPGRRDGPSVQAMGYRSFAGLLARHCFASGGGTQPATRRRGR
jgi:hypothetical protein